MRTSLAYSWSKISIYLIKLDEIDFKNYFSSSEEVWCMFCTEDFSRYHPDAIDSMIESLLLFQCKAIYYMGKWWKDLLSISDQIIVWNAIEKNLPFAEPVWCFWNDYDNIDDVETDIFMFWNYKHGNDMQGIINKFIFCDNERIYKEVLSMLNGTNYDV